MPAKFSGPWEGIYQVHPHHITTTRPISVCDQDFIDRAPLTVQSSMSRPFVMSYFYFRLRLAEISRTIGDQYTSATRRSCQPEYSCVADADAELEQLIADVPQRLRLATYKNGIVSSEENALFAQAYMFATMMQTHRCRLHSN